MRGLSAENWTFKDHFEPPRLRDDQELDPTIQAARAYLALAAIDHHPFFHIAIGNREALQIWAAQESVITNYFSQTLFSMMALIKNVHLRSVLLPVAVGEHSALKGGQAVGSHPHLLAKLVIDIGCIPETIHHSKLPMEN